MKAPRCPECGARLWMWGTIDQEACGDCTSDTCSYSYDSVYEDDPDAQL